jgi:hypothetical protein
MPGVNYFLSFDLIGSGRGLTTSSMVTFGSFSQTFTLASGDDTTGIVSNALVTVSSATPAFLTFQSLTPGNVGTVLDNVSVVSAPVSTGGAPEPSALFLIPSALLALPLWKRRRRTSRQS